LRSAFRLLPAFAAILIPASVQSKKSPHAVQVGIRAEFALFFRPIEHAHKRLALHSRSIPSDPGDVGIPLTELADRIESHAAVSLRSPRARARRSFGSG
jgi:hypothetical protein